jgi:hypothetical protein
MNALSPTGPNHDLVSIISVEQKDLYHIDLIAATTGHPPRICCKKTHLKWDLIGGFSKSPEHRRWSPDKKANADKIGLPPALFEC